MSNAYVSHEICAVWLQSIKQNMYVMKAAWSLDRSLKSAAQKIPNA